MRRIKNWKPGIYTALCVGIGSQISFTAFTTGFIITLAVVLLGVFLKIYENVNPFMLTFLTAFWSPFFRGLIEYSKIGDFSVVFRMVAPDVMFYVAYGIVFYLFYNCTGEKNEIKFIFAVGLSDCMAKICEMMIRMNEFFLTSSLYIRFIEIAGVRSMIIMLVVVAIHKYRDLLISEEDEQRYKKLVVMASVFNSEVYFMEKNMIEIEDVMKKAFVLSRALEHDRFSESERKLALDISKDVHEIKKDYLRVIKGLEDNFLSDVKSSEMSIRHIAQILMVDINEKIKDENLRIRFNIINKCDFMVVEHFSLVAILRNLIHNSLEAIGSGKSGYVDLSIYRENDNYMFAVLDNGPGIKEEDLDVLYEIGFSTKFDGTTGNINRGIGLSLVLSLVKDVFNGNIFVESLYGSYTKFIVSIPCDSMKGDRR